ncbi:hypothetical protein AVEN_105283-1 [Araneus ventricosus]|uniref:Uncharacterized protein n=1 Tax=Araneus ventricosus TaxID=182803 RepID=A0A4Y2TCQ8_ARAVE|nr:hypothetical protein AVEN_105283-1 [Araneus ventricosus]
MRDGQCCKSFPKQFKDDTEENVNGYPIYRRRATEPVQDMMQPRSKCKKKVLWIMMKFLSFVEGMYVSTPEAMWRLNEFNLSRKSHTVVSLALHLPQQQPNVYQDGQEAQAIERAALGKKH